MKKINSIFILPIILLNCSFTNYNTVTITIYSYTQSYNYVNNTMLDKPGHSFITLTNNYSWPLELPYYTIGPFSTASIGLWSGTNDSSSSSGSLGSSNAPGYSGIYFNREAYIFSHSENMLDCYQYTFEFSRSEFLNDKTLNFFKNNNDYYDLFSFNCSCFVIDLLKCFTDYNLYNFFDSILGTATPEMIKNSMKNLFKDKVIESNEISITSSNFQKYNRQENKMMYFDNRGEY